MEWKFEILDNAYEVRKFLTEKLSRAQSMASKVVASTQLYGFVVYYPTEPEPSKGDF